MAQRERISLDGQWKFSPTKILDTDNCSLVTVPSPWQADPRFRDHTGKACYQREFDIPAKWLKKDRVIILGFGAVDYLAEVWLNGVKVGEHEGGYLSFELDITEAARPGTNTLSVHVDDPLEIFSEIPHGKQSWYGMLSGIWQSVWMESRAATHIHGVKISTNGDQVSVDVSVRGEPTAGVAIALYAPNGSLVIWAASHTPHISLRVEQPLRWSPDEPNLYTLKVFADSDAVIETFGFRTIETRDGKILLNGRPFYLRGALDQDYYPDLIATPPSQEYIEDQFRRAKEMGLNCLRVHIKVANPGYYAAADKVGLLIWTELPNHILLNDEAKRRARDTLAGMVARDWNHPSIGVWTIINESWGIDLTDPSQRAWLAETYEWLKAIDLTRLVVDNSACWGNAHLETDIADFHIYYAMPDHFRHWRDWVADYARRPWWLFTHEYEAHAVWRDFLRDPWHASEGLPATEVHQRGDEPLVVSEFGNWGLPNVTKLIEGNGGEAPWWFDTGLEWGDGAVYPRGIEQRFKDYYLDRVFSSLEELSEASQRLQFQALKFEIEQMRRYESIQGYIITEFTDVHWECNGLLDMYRNPKIHYPLLRTINSDDLLIPLWEQLALSSGQTYEIKILFSHYSNVEIEDAMLRWELSVGQLPVSSGQMSIGACSSFGVTKLGGVSFSAPQVEHPSTARLDLHCFNGETLIASTAQDFYIFPSVTPSRKATRLYAPDFKKAIKPFTDHTVQGLAHADVVVVNTLDDGYREFLLQGGKVLFLAEDDHALQTYIPGLSIKYRRGTPWQGDWASSFGWHRFKIIPTGGVVDFAFAGLTPEHILQGFAPRDFAQDVYAGLFVGWLHKPVPTIARKRVGRGELLISTFQLSTQLETNPLARYLFCELLELIS